MVDYIPKRGDFIRLSFDPQAGHEQMGNRPALVVSQTSFNQRMGFVFVCPVTNSKRENPFYVAISGEKNVTGVIMADQLRSLDYRARKATFVGKCANELFLEVLARIEPIIFDS